MIAREENRDGQRLLLRTFDSFGDLVRYASQPNDVVSPKSRRPAKGSHWDMGADFNETVRLAEKGWPEGLKLIDRIRARLESVTSSATFRPETNWDVAGDFVDIGRFVSGVPECMGTFDESEQQQQTTGKIVRVVVNCAASSGVDASAMARRGAAAGALIDALESVGRSCEIVLLCANGMRGSWLEYLVPVKRAGEPLELDRLAMMLCHPTVYRRLFFSCFELESASTRRTHNVCASGGYGHVDSGRYLIDAREDIIVPDMLLYSRGDDDSALLKWVFSELKKQGVEVAETATK